MRYFSIVLVSLFILAVSDAHGQNLTSAEEYSQRGMTRFEKNDLDGAIADFTKVIEMNGAEKEFAYYFRGIAHYRKGNADHAIADLSEAIAIKGNPRFYDDRGNLLAKKGDFDGAVADLNKAVEIAPQYAKAYCDRGIVRLMQTEATLAEVDFKKCFELDKTLASQFKAAATKIKQRTIAHAEHQKPSDVEVVKFSWAETPSTILIAPSSPSIPVSTSTVSQSGTRVLADPTSKGQPGPGDIPDLTSTGLPGGPMPSGNTRTVLDYKFTALIKNTGSKTIQGVQWGYVFDPKDPAHEALAHVFATKTNIAPGKEKSLHDSIPGSATPSGRAKVPTKKTRDFYIERIVILRLDYADGATWESTAASGTQKTRSPN